jgi:hypothetical protein
LSEADNGFRQIAQKFSIAELTARLLAQIERFAQYCRAGGH